MLAYEKKGRATIAQRQKNLLVEHLGDIRTAIEKSLKFEEVGFGIEFFQDTTWCLLCF